MPEVGETGGGRVGLRLVVWVVVVRVATAALVGVVRVSFQATRHLRHEGVRGETVGLLLVGHPKTGRLVAH